MTTLATEHEVAFIGLPSRHRQLPLVVPLILLMHPFISDSIGVSHDPVTGAFALSEIALVVGPITISHLALALHVSVSELTCVH